MWGEGNKMTKNIEQEESFEMQSRFWRGLLLGIGVFGTLVYPIREYIHDRNYIRVPTNIEVQEGYVKPSELEIQVSDLDNNGKKELMMKYKGKSYLLIQDNEGNPKISLYDIKPEEMKPAKINLK